ncbi:MAG: sirohydrochlorin chelatase [Capsulimonadaceae bacterium]
MKALILFSHGSLLCGSGEALEEHAVRLRAAGLWPRVEIGYLNYSEPTFADVVTRCVSDARRQGEAADSIEIVVQPYFLVPGHFVSRSLPDHVHEAQGAHPGVRFAVGQAIGFDERLADAIVDSALSPLGPDEWFAELASTASGCQIRPECPLHGTPTCPVTGGVDSAPPGVPRRTGAASPADGLPSSSDGSTRTALIVMVHGSPKPGANDDMFRVTQIVRDRPCFDIVEAGFMECNEPTIATAIDSAVYQGANRVIAVAYFLHTGTHVTHDLPTLLQEARARHRGIEFGMGRYLGRSEHLTHILADRALGAIDFR